MVEGRQWQIQKKVFRVRRGKRGEGKRQDQACFPNHNNSNEKHKSGHKGQNASPRWPKKHPLSPTFKRIYHLENNESRRTIFDHSMSPRGIWNVLSSQQMDCNLWHNFSWQLSFSHFSSTSTMSYVASINSIVIYFTQTKGPHISVIKAHTWNVALFYVLSSITTWSSHFFWTHSDINMLLHNGHVFHGNFSFIHGLQGGQSSCDNFPYE